MKEKLSVLIMTLLIASCTSKIIYINPCKNAPKMNHDLSRLDLDFKRDVAVYKCVCLEEQEVCDKIDNEYKKLNK